MQIQEIMAGSFNNGSIRLDTNPISVFYSGQVLSGSVVFDLDQPITFSVIYIQFLGEAHVLWTESEIETVNGVEKHKLIKYAGREEYFNSTQQLAGGNGNSQLPAGGQNFPFKFQIPFTAPSSFKGVQGEVTYSMTAHLVYQEPSVHEVITKYFQVVAPFDLNLGSPKIRQPIDLEFEEEYGCGCFCSPGPVTIRLRLPVSGYCPGQVIPVAIDVENGSSVEITKMIFEILSRELYRSQYPASEFIPPETVLVTVKRGAVMGHSKGKFTTNLVVPEIIPPNLENCGIIDVGYFFRITIKLAGCNDELQDEAELCLGLVPVREFTEGEYVHPLAHCLPTGPIPIPDPNRPSELTVPPVTTGFRGSNTSLQRVQYNPAQAGSCQNNPPPYSSGNGNYPAENRFQTPVSMEMKPRPYQDYAIGFKGPQGSPAGNTPGYPNNVPSGINPPPYVMPSLAQPPYPTSNMMPISNRGGFPYAQGEFVPSAPPPN